MITKARLLSSAALIACVAQAAQAQAPTTPQTAPQMAPSTVAPAGSAAAAPVTETIVVRGIRRSLQSAVDKKRNATQIVDSIVAEDIGKLPDANVAEALQRINGVQVTRDTDETGQHQVVIVQGLPNVISELNGRDVFSAGFERTLNFDTIPSEMIASADVYKSPEAWQIEGGLGGIIDFTLHRPFDFKGLTYAGSVTGDYATQANNVEPNFSGFVSDRWDTEIGEMGLLLSATSQERNWRTDEASVFDYNSYSPTNPATGENLTDGKYFTPYGSSQDFNFGHRHTLGLDASAQWKPQDNLEFYLDAYYTRLHNDKNVESLEFEPYTGEYAANPVPYPGTDSLRSGDFEGGPGILAQSFHQTDINNTYQIAGGAKYYAGPVSINAEADYIHTTYSQIYDELSMAQYTGGSSVDVDYGSTVPKLNIMGTSASAPQGYWNFNSVQYYDQYTVGDETAGKVDAKVQTDAGPLADIRAGLRVADRTEESHAVDYDGTPYDNAANYANSIVQTSYDDLFSGVSGFPSAWSIPNPALLGNTQNLFSTFDQGPVPGFDPLMTFEDKEQSYAGYAMGDLATTLFGYPVDGNIGLRLVDTQQQLIGAIDSRDNSFLTPLPSANIRIKLQPDVYLRLAGSRVFSLANFQDLNPSVILNNVANTGYKGNPDLKPLEATQADVSLEYYFARSGIVHGSAFYKDITNYVGYTATPVFYTYQCCQAVTMPFNQAGTVKGLEVGYQQFYDFLPHPFNSLGLQFNYTYLDSYAKNVDPLLDAPLADLSRHSANLVGLYEDDNFSARLAFNWRSSFVDQFVNAQDSILARVQYEKGYGTLDASLGYHLNTHLTAFVEGSNITRPLRKIYYSDGTNAGAEREDSRIIFGIRFKN
jgi:TonB-dependent receptor